MKEIIELNTRLRENPRSQLPAIGLMLDREDTPKELELIPAQLRKEINDLRKALNGVIPDDFGYLLCLGDAEPALTLRYENGNMTGAGGGDHWKETVSIFEQLKDLDWDNKRKWAIETTETFDVITAIAKELPVMIRPTKALRKDFSGSVKAYIKEKRSDALRVYALLWDGEESLLDKDFDDMKAFERELPDIMTFMLQVLTVVAEGRPMPAERIDALKRAALKKLEDMPISHAKASGKFAFIMSQVQAQGRE